MIFFSDALEGQTITTTPTATSVCLNKNVRTGQTTASGTALSVALSWTTAVSYDAVVLVYSDATRFGILLIEPVWNQNDTNRNPYTNPP